MATARQSFMHLLQSIGHLARTRLGVVALAAIVPFVASHLVVLQARRIGMPERLILDFLHGVIVLSYLTAVVRIAQNRGVGRAVGAAWFGLAWPKTRWPGLAVVARMTAATVLIGLPLALLLHPLVQAIELAQDAGAIYFPVTMLPEYVMTTLVGLVLAAGTTDAPS